MYDLAEARRVEALKKILIGKTREYYELWQAEKMPFDPPPLSASGRPQHMLRPALRRVFEDCPGHVGGLLHHGLHRLLREADLHPDQQHHRGNGLSPLARPLSAPRGARRGSRTVGFCRCAPAPQGAMCTRASAAPGAGPGMPRYRSSSTTRGAGAAAVDLQSCSASCTAGPEHRPSTIDPSYLGVSVDAESSTSRL